MKQSAWNAKQNLFLSDFTLPVVDVPCFKHLNTVNMHSWEMLTVLTNLASCPELVQEASPARCFHYFSLRKSLPC